jgi:hypothetical protein
LSVETKMNATGGGAMQRWVPRELLARARQQEHELFVRGGKCPLYLVVVLDEPASDLAQGLKAETGADQDGLPFRTAAVMSSRRESMRPAHLTLVSEPQQREQRAVQRLIELSKLCCHVLPLRKRVESAFLTSISVGRARNHDIVLRHASVSKFHANLEVDGTRLFVKDAGSRNHTFLNHERVLARTEVYPGDNLRFGWVEAVMVSDAALWRAVRGSAD